MTSKEKTLFALTLTFLATLFMPWLPLLNIFSVIALTLYVFFFDCFEDNLSLAKNGSLVRLIQRKRELLNERKYLPWMLLFFLMIVISVFLSSNLHKALRYLDPRLPLFYFPISIGLLELNKSFRQKLLLSFAWLTCFILIVCLGWAIYRSGFFKQTEFLYNDSLTEILDQQSIYIALLVNISIYIFARHVLQKDTRYKWVIIVAIVFLFVMSYLLASRNQMLVLYAAVIMFAGYSIVKRKRIFAGIVLLVGLAIGLFLVFRLFPKTFNRYRELVYTGFNYAHLGKESHYNMTVTKDQWNGANFRIAAWECGWELFLESPVKGVNIGDKKDRLMEKYREKDFQFALLTQKNVHNNYLDILYSMGIIGLGLFVVGWLVLPLNYARQKNDGLAMLIILSFGAAWVTEIYFDRSLGGMLTGFFIPFLLAEKEK